MYIVEFKGQRWEGERHRVFSFRVDRPDIMDAMARMSYHMIAQVVPVEDLLGGKKQGILIGTLEVHYVPS